MAGDGFLDAFANWIVDQIDAFGDWFHDSGVGTSGPAVDDAALGSATGDARIAGADSQPSPEIFQTVATIPYTGSLAITEWGLWTLITSGVLMLRSVFAAINVGNGDSIQFTAQVTINSSVV